MSRRTSLPLTSNYVFRDESLVELGEQMLKCVAGISPAAKFLDLPCTDLVRAEFCVEREK